MLFILVTLIFKVAISFLIVQVPGGGSTIHLEGQFVTLYYSMHTYIKFQKRNVGLVRITYECVFCRPQKTHTQKYTKMGFKPPTSDQLNQIELILFWNVLKYNAHGMIKTY